MERVALQQVRRETAHADQVLGKQVLDVLPGHERDRGGQERVAVDRLVGHCRRAEENQARQGRQGTAAKHP
jgi:hypothetical protein